MEMEKDEYGLDALERYADAVAKFEELRQEARETEAKLDAMLVAYNRFELSDVNEVVDKYCRICDGLKKADSDIGRLYDLCIRSLDDSFKHTCEVRLPRLMLSYINGKKTLIRSLYYDDD